METIRDHNGLLKVGNSEAEADLSETNAVTTDRYGEKIEQHLAIATETLARRASPNQHETLSRFAVNSIIFAAA